MKGFERSDLKSSQINGKEKSRNSEDEEHDEYLEAKRRKRSGLPPVKEEKKTKPFKRTKTYKADVVTSVKVVMKEDCSLLNYEAVSAGMVILGCVHELSESAATVSLPGSIFAIAPRNFITPLRDLSLKKVLNEGQIVVCKVFSKKTSLDNSWKVIVSLDPARVNSHIPHYAVDVGMSLMGVVQSIEDHGYIIDSGISNLRTFLSTSAAKHWCNTFNEGEALEVGQLIRCYVSKRNSNNSASNVELMTAIDLSNPLNSGCAKVSNILPGTLIEGSVKKKLSDGVKVSAKGLRCPAYINNFHIKKSKKPNPIFCSVVLYADASNSKIMLGSHPCFMQISIAKAECPSSTVVDNAKVVSVKRDGVTIKFLKDDRSLTGFIPISSIEKLVTSKKLELDSTDSVLNSTNDSDYSSDVDAAMSESTDQEPAMSQTNIFNRLQRKLKQLKFLSCRILHYSYMDQIYLCSFKSDFDDMDVNLKDFQLKNWPEWLKIGKAYLVSVMKVTQKFLSIKINDEICGVIPVNELSDNIDLTSLLLQSYCEEDVIKNVYFCYLDENVPVFSIKQSMIQFFEDAKNQKALENGWSSVSDGMVLPCIVSEVMNGRMSGIIVSTPVPSFPEVMVTDDQLLSSTQSTVSVFWSTVVDRPVCKQTILAKVIKHDATELALDCRLSQVWDFDLESSVRSFQNFLKEEAQVQRLSTGSKVQCVVSSKNPDGSWRLNFLVYTGIHGLLPSEFSGKKNLASGTNISAMVIWDDPNKNTVHVTCDDETISQNYDQLDKITEGSSFKCKLLYRHVDFSIASIQSKREPNLDGHIVYIIKKLHLNDFQRFSGQVNDEVGEIVDVHVLKVENQMIFAVLADVPKLVKIKASESSDRKVSKKWKQEHLNDNDSSTMSEKVERKKSKTEKEEVSGKKNKLLMMLNDLVQDDSDDESVESKNTKIQSKKSKKSQKKALDKRLIDNETSDKDDEMDIAFDKNVKSQKSVESKLSDAGFDWNASLASLQEIIVPKLDSDVEDEDKDDGTSKKKKKMTASERREISKQKEAKIRQTEEELLNAEKNPQSADHFDRLLLASPNNSALWIKYMAYHLQGTEIEKAKSVAKRALQIINHREEEERLNVWSALLNLENLYGSPDSFQKCLNDAILTNDEWKIYSRVMQIYVNSKKMKELERLVDIATKKLRSTFDVYVACGEYLLQAGLVEKSRSIMQRALSALPKKQHVDLTVRFAHFENRYGCQERAHTLFEHILTSFPKRIDVWISYVDLLVKGNRIDLARQVIERGVAQKLKPHKMKSLYTKWLNFEKEHGTPEEVLFVKQEIKQYVDKDS